MTTVLPSMGLELPTRGAPGAGQWGNTEDANLARIDQHSHGPGSGVRITPAAININADLPLNSSWGITTANRISFASVATPSTNKSVFVSDGSGGLTANELYWRSNTGTNVKITASNALNVAAFVGGIGGDYSSVSALVDYDDATDTYRFRQEINAAVRQFAKVRFADIQLVEYDAAGDASVPANAVTIKSPDALAANYSVTMPAALPGSTVLVQMDSSGVLTASNTLATNASITLSGTGEVKHGLRSDTYPGVAAIDQGGVAPTRDITTGSLTSNGPSAHTFALRTQPGNRTQSVTIAAFGNGTADATVALVKVSAGGATTTIASGSILNAPASWADYTFTGTATIGARDALFLAYQPLAAGLTINNVALNFDHP